MWTVLRVGGRFVACVEVAKRRPQILIDEEVITLYTNFKDLSKSLWRPIITIYGLQGQLVTRSDQHLLSSHSRLASIYFATSRPVLIKLIFRLACYI